MKKNVLIFIFSFFVVFGNCTKQKPDYLIIGNDTLPINKNPLFYYFHQVHTNFYEKIAKKYMETIDSNGVAITIITSTNCWDDYVAYWKIENDSLKLWSIEDCCKCIPLTGEEIVKEIFGDNNIFAYWFSGEIKIPKSPFLTEFRGNIFPVYELEEKITFVNGIIQIRELISNREYIQNLRLEKKLNEKIMNLKDTFNYIFQKQIFSYNIFKEGCNCSDSYHINYSKNGKLKSVDIVPFYLYEGFFWENLIDNFYQKKCLRIIKSEISKLSLSFIEAHRDFQITIKIMDKSGIIFEYYESYDIK
jgi:hypothetical protein